MASIDIEALLLPIGDDEPTGPDLEYDPELLAAFQAAEGTPERRMGDAIVAAEEPDWRRVQELSVGLLGRSKDLRVGVLLARAALRVSGVEGLAQGLALLAGLVDRHWDLVHPKLDPADDNDPTARLNCLLDLCSREAVLDALRATPLIRSRVFGPLSLRDIEIAEGKAPAADNAKPLDPAAVNGVFQDCALEDLVAASASAAGALEQVRRLGKSLAEHVSAGRAPDLDPLAKPLAAISALLAQRLAERQPGSVSGELSASAPDAATPSQGAPMTGDIRSREDVLRAIDRICDYYSTKEPSSPVPLLLKRARRLVTGSFIDIVRDLAPDAISQVEKVCGAERAS